MTTNN